MIALADPSTVSEASFPKFNLRAEFQPLQARPMMRFTMRLNERWGGMEGGSCGLVQHLHWRDLWGEKGVLFRRGGQPMQFTNLINMNSLFELRFISG